MARRGIGSWQDAIDSLENLGWDRPETRSAAPEAIKMLTNMFMPHLLEHRLATGCLHLKKSDEV